MKNSKQNDDQYFSIGLNHGRLDRLHLDACGANRTDKHYKINGLYKRRSSYAAGYNQGTLYQQHRTVHQE